MKIVFDVNFGRRNRCNIYAVYTKIFTRKFEKNFSKLIPLSTQPSTKMPIKKKPGAARHKVSFENVHEYVCIFNKLHLHVNFVICSCVNFEISMTSTFKCSVLLPYITMPVFLWYVVTLSRSRTINNDSLTSLVWKLQVCFRSV